MAFKVNNEIMMEFPKSKTTMTFRQAMSSYKDYGTYRSISSNAWSSTYDIELAYCSRYNKPYMETYSLIDAYYSAFNKTGEEFESRLSLSKTAEVINYDVFKWTSTSW